MTLRSRFSGLSRPQKWISYTALAVLAYGALGFLVAPPILRSQTEQALAELLGRKPSIAEVSINPFALSLSVRGFELRDPDHSRFFEFEELYVNLQLSSVFHGAWALSEARVDAPYVHVKVQKNGSLNFADILDRLASESELAAEELAEDEPSPPPPMLIFLAKVSEGRILFSDFSRPTPFEHEISPLNVEIRDFGTRPDDESPYSFSATDGAGESLHWEGNLSVVPLYSSGRFALTGIRPRTGWLYFQDDLTFEVVDGSVDIGGRYAFDARDGLSGLVDEGTIEFRDFAIAERESGERAVEIPLLDIEGITLRYPEQQLHAAKISSKGGRYHLQRMANGRFRVERFLESRRQDRVEEETDIAQQPPAPASEASEVPAAEGDDPGEEADQGDWSAEIDAIEITELRVEFDDLSTPEPVHLEFDPVSLVIGAISTEADNPARVDLDLTLQQTGRIGIAGRLGARPPLAELDLEIADVDLQLFEPYWSELADLDMQSGLLSLSGHAVAKELGSPSQELGFEGGLGVADLRTTQRSLGQPLVSWTAVALEGLSVRVDPTSVHLQKLALRDPSARILIDRDGSTNLQRVMIATSEEVPEADAPERESDEPEVAAETPADLPIRIDLVEVEGASARFDDHSVKPSFSSGLTDLKGRVEGLSSDPASRSKLHLEGKLNGATPVRVDGVVSPLASEVYADVQLHFANVELTRFTPYAGRFVGNTIDRGKLFLDLDYELDGKVLAGENKLFLDQFTLGQKVKSPEAVDLPIGLAIGLLKDHKGEIHIDLPIRGRVDDPDFSVVGLIASALRNLITKVALSPFSLMGSLVGQNGDAMKFVEFEPGSAEILPEQHAKLDALATALAERPGLSLELSGTVAPAQDRPALQKAALEAQLRQTAFAESREKWFGDKPRRVEDVQLTAEDTTRLLTAAYLARFGESPDTLLEPTPPGAVAEKRSDEPSAAESERMLRAARSRLEADMTIDDTKLRDLARRRARSIRDTLVAEGRVSAERVFLLETTIDDRADSPGPRSLLSLAVH